MDEIKVICYLPSDRRYYICRWTDPVTGKPKFETTGETSETKANKFADKLEAKLQAGVYKSSLKVSWMEFRERFLEEYVSPLRDSTRSKYLTVFNQFEECITLRKVSTINAQHISRFVQDQRAKGNEEATIRGYLGYLHKSLVWAKEQGMLREIPSFSMPKAPKKTKVMKGRPVTGEEFDRILEAVPKVVGKDYTDEWVYFLKGLWWSGLRLDEALRLTWNVGGFALVEIKGHYYFRISSDSEKGKQDRILPIAPEYELLIENDPSNKGRVYNPRKVKMRTPVPRVDTISKIITTISEKANVVVDVRKKRDDKGRKYEVEKYAGAHDLRRSFGTRWAERVMPKILMELMRHESIETTMKYYVGQNAASTTQILWKSLPGNSSGNSDQNQEIDALEELRKTL